MSIWKRLLVDRISITVVIGSKDFYHQTENRLYTLKAKQPALLPLGKIKVFQGQYLRRLDYYAAYGKSKASKRKIADIKVGANRLFGGKSMHRYFSLTLYPSQFKAGDFQTFKDLLTAVMPEFNYAKLHQTGKVTYLELAADSLTHKHHSFLPYRKYTKTSKIWKEDGGHLGTTYIGSNTSPQRFRIYDKHKQLLDTGKEPYSNVFPQTRIEAVVRKLGVAPVDLINMKNPFKKLAIADLAAAKAASDDQDWQDFIVESLKIGVPQALSNHPTIRKKYMAMLDTVQAPWWSPEFLWQGLPKALAVIAP
ncbi:replication initiation factor domain-containing protein [Polaromonas sp. C04]|uniref:replication initiation factor domain-containing protein n=1 Tax=Polaromonas sp. C04 TaxID=1945857 RepID=UPI00098450A4|nr:replication initiation factor domain-containing protein [Polaromonas sp. C04]OOG58897.1 hypothetical protein B0E49_03105 [Polaromonas sp. C04]